VIKVLIFCLRYRHTQAASKSQI